MSGVPDWSPPWSTSVGELAPIAPTKGLPSMASGGGGIVRPPGFPGLELAVPHDAAAGIETLVEHALDTTVAGIEHSLLDPPTPDSLSTDTVFGPSYSRLTKTGLDDATARGVARWGGAVFFITNHLADARDRFRWLTDDRRAAERRKAKDAVDRLALPRLMGRWGGAEPAQRLRRQTLSDEMDALLAGHTDGKRRGGLRVNLQRPHDHGFDAGIVNRARCAAARLVVQPGRALLHKTCRHLPTVCRSSPSLAATSVF